MSHAYNRVRRGLLALAVLLLAVASNGIAQWATAPDVPSVRTMAMQAALNGKIYVWGGSTAEVTPDGYPQSSTPSGIMLNTPGGTSWTTLTPLPGTGRSGGSAVAVNNKIYIVAGLSVSGTQLSFQPAVLEFDPVANTYTEKAAMQQPVFCAPTVAVGSKIYVFGGISVQNNQLIYGNWTQVYDVVANTWSISATPAPFGQFNGQAFAVGTEIFLVGGTAGNVLSNETWKTGLSGQGDILGWSKIANYPMPISSAAAGTLNGKGYIAGGYNGTEMTNKVYRLEDGVWKPWYSLPTPLANVTNMPNDGTSMYYISGVNSRKVYKLSEGTAVPIAAVDRPEHLVTTKTGVLQNITIGVTNNGVADLRGSLDIPAEAQAWLSTPNTAFNDVVPGSTRNLTLNVGSLSLNPGNYSAVVKVMTNDESNPEIPVRVRLYVRNELAEQSMKLVVEEATGTWCGWCPEGHAALAEAEEIFGEDMVALAYHGPPNSTDTFTIQSGYNVLAKMSPGISYPSAAIQRRMFPGEKTQLTNRGAWATYIGQVLSAEPQAPIAVDVLKYKFNPTTKEVTAKLRLTVAQALPVGSNSTIRVTAVLAQDSMLSKQTEYRIVGNQVQEFTLNPYYQRHAVRGVYPDANGQEVSLPEGSVEENVVLPGTVIETNMTFVANNTSDPARSEIVFMVHGLNGPRYGEIFQAVDLHLTENISSTGYVVTTPTSTKSVTTADTAKFTTDVKNNGTSPVTITVERTENDMPGASWQSWFCVGDNCTTPTVNTMDPIVVAPGETKTINVHIMGKTAGTGRVTLRYTDSDGESTDQMYTANVGGSSVEREAVAGNGMRLSQNVPNPAFDITTFNYTLPSTGSVDIEVFSMSGEKLFAIAKDRVEAGTHNFALDVNALTSGTYTVRLTSNGVSLSRMITVVR